MMKAYNMLVVELKDDDLDATRSFVKIGMVAGAIARANVANNPNLLDAERKIFPRINAAVQQNFLNPIDPETHVSLSRSDYGIGIVPFAELVEWGRATKLYDFKRPRNEKVKNMLLKMAEEERIREANQPELMRLLASKKHLRLGDWIEITGLGIGDEDHYTTTEKSIRFIGWPDDFISSFPPHEQADMVRQNAEPGLAFPCTPKELLDFVDNGAGRLYGSFLVPDEFRNAVNQVGQAPTPSEDEPSNEEYVSWYDAQMDAATWWSLKSVTPIEAAQLMCQFNPHDNNDYPTTITNDETAPDDYKRLLRIFEDEEKADAKARNLSQWRDIARDKKLKYHSWIDKYAQAMKLLELAAPSAEQAECDGKNGVRVPVAKQQDNAILNWLKENKYDPLKLPVGDVGKAGVKSVCKAVVRKNASLFSSNHVFDTAWDRLRANGETKVSE